MEKLIEHGISFSLDDFGAGSSNLHYIVAMPVEIVKLDKHLTEEYFNNPKAQAIVKTVVGMAHSMGLRIISEGIETAEQKAAMEELGIDYLQGYYFSYPLPEHEFLRFIQNEPKKSRVYSVASCSIPFYQNTMLSTFSQYHPIAKSGLLLFLNKAHLAPNSGIPHCNKKLMSSVRLHLLRQVWFSVNLRHWLFIIIVNRLCHL